MVDAARIYQIALTYVYGEMHALQARQRADREAAAQARTQAGVWQGWRCVSAGRRLGGRPQVRNPTR
jgi:hypothetical protein